MAGYPHKALRDRVRRYLMTAEGQESSDRYAAAKKDCSKLVVSQVRRQLIHAGQHPPRPEYREAVRIRGGYVLVLDGRILTETDWRRELAARDRGKPKGRGK